MTVAYEKVYLDLDRTLFRTSEFSQKLWQVIAELYDAPALAAEKEREAQFYVTNPSGYYYDMFAHAREVGIDGVSLRTKLLESRLRSDDLLFDDVAVLIEYLRGHGSRVEVLTFGKSDYQQLKVDLCPALDGILATIIQSDKSQWLQDKKGALVIDDKPLGKDLPTEINFVQVLLENQEQKSQVSWPVLRTIQEVIALIGQSNQ